MKYRPRLHFTHVWTSQSLASALAVFVALGSGYARAEQLNFKVTSAHPSAVQLEFRSMARPGHSWPGPGRVYNLEDDETHALPITCEEGEQVCYGAWVKGDYSVFWGIGHANSHRCTKCCYTCNGGSPNVSLTN